MCPSVRVFVCLSHRDLGNRVSYRCTCFANMESLVRGGAQSAFPVARMRALRESNVGTFIGLCVFVRNEASYHHTSFASVEIRVGLQTSFPVTKMYHLRDSNVRSFSKLSH